MEYLIRPARNQDIRSIRELWQEMMSVHSSFDPRFRFSRDAPRAYERHLTRAIYSSSALVLVAVADSVVIGYSIAEISDRQPILPEGSYAFISDMCVTASHRRKGIGRALMGEMMKWMKEHKITAIQLLASEFNENGLAFWRSMGFGEYLKMMRFDL
jgi:ribosomal protein S18 acetylase RimI-like enzyme